MRFKPAESLNGMRKQCAALTVTFFLLITFSGFSLGGEPLSGELSDFLINIEGWRAVSGSEIDAAIGKIKMINAIRTYARDECVITAAIIITGKELTVKQFREADNSVDEDEIFLQDIEGFLVYNFYEIHEKAGAVSVLLGEGESCGAVFTLSFSEITREDAQEIVRQFDWRMMKEAVEKYL